MLFKFQNYFILNFQTMRSRFLDCIILLSEHGYHNSY